MAEQVQLSVRPDMALVRLEAEADRLLVRPGRTILGIAGGPGAGKSTLAVRLVEALNRETPGLAAYVPMDGFHLKQSVLEAQGIAADKGMPHTFDVDAFELLLARLKATHEPEAIEAARETMLSFGTKPTGAYYPTGIERADNIAKTAAQD